MKPMNGGYESNLVATVFCYKAIIRKEEQYQMARRYHEIKGLAEFTAKPRDAKEAKRIGI